jgi:MFS family permease
MNLGEALARLVPSELRAEGIKGRYSTLLLVSSAHAAGHGYLALMPLVYPFIMTELDLSYSQLGLILALTGVVGALFQFVFGVLGRYFLRKLLIAFGVALMSVSVGLLSLVANFGQFIAYSLLRSIGSSPQHPNGNSLLLESFSKKHYGRVIAWHFSGGNLGTVLLPPLGGALIVAFGWKLTLLLAAIPGVLISLPILALIQEKKPSSTAGGAVLPPTIMQELGKIVRNRRLMLAMLAQTMAAGGKGVGVIMTFVPLYLARDLGISIVHVGGLLSVMLVGSVLGPIALGHVSDRISKRKPLILTVYICSTFLVILFAASAHYTFILPVTLFFIGNLVYAQSPLLQSMIADLTPAECSKDMVFGFFFTVSYTVGALWAAFFGYAIDVVGFVSTFQIVSLSYVLAALALIFCQEVRDQKRATSSP